MKKYSENVHKFAVSLFYTCVKYNTTSKWMLILSLFRTMWKWNRKWRIISKLT